MAETMTTFQCPICKNHYTITLRNYKQRSKNSKTGKVCCSRECSYEIKKRSRCVGDAYVKETELRFWSKVDKTPGLGPQGECWEWRGTIEPKGGYGDFCAFNKNIPAHRFSWEISNNKKIRKGMVIMHSCDNRKCVNPNHLSEGTNADNTADMVRKGRHIKGGKNSSAIVSDCQALLIRKLCFSHTKKELAKMFNTSLASVSKIVNNKSYKHLPHTLRPPYKISKKPIPKLSDKQLKYLLSRVTPNGNTNQCWLWSGDKNSYGYGVLGVNGKIYKIHRLAYALFHNLGDIPSELVVRHGKNCPKTCVSPFHLKLGTDFDNARDRWSN